MSFTMSTEYLDTEPCVDLYSDPPSSNVIENHLSRYFKLGFDKKLLDWYGFVLLGERMFGSLFSYLYNPGFTILGYLLVCILLVSSFFEIYIPQNVSVILFILYALATSYICVRYKSSYMSKKKICSSYYRWIAIPQELCSELLDICNQFEVCARYRHKVIELGREFSYAEYQVMKNYAYDNRYTNSCKKLYGLT